MGRNNNSYTEEQIIDFDKLRENVCMNIRIARKLANISIEEAAPKLAIEPSSLRKIEAPNVAKGTSLEVLGGAIELFGQDANFYFKDWKENNKLLDD